MFQHILFPIDFSERCKQAVPFVKAFANYYRAKVSLMHVVQIPTAWYGAPDVAYPIIVDVEQMEKNAYQELTKFYIGPNALGPSTVVAKTVTTGEPSLAIVQYAEQSGVDLIMMPTHGYGKFRRFLLGSVTAQVLHDAHCPVWTAAHTEPHRANPAEYLEILCAVDGTEKSLPLIHEAVQLGSELAATVRLVHALPFLDPDMNVPAARVFIEASRRQIGELQRKAGINLELCLETGNVSDVVHKAAVHHNAELIVIGRGRIHERFGGIKTNAYAIIRDSPCPVLSV